MSKNEVITRQIRNQEIIQQVFLMKGQIPLKQNNKKPNETNKPKKPAKV
jgi:hypothetical protein